MSFAFGLLVALARTSYAECLGFPFLDDVLALACTAATEHVRALPLEEELRRRVRDEHEQRPLQHPTIAPLDRPTYVHEFDPCPFYVRSGTTSDESRRQTVARWKQFARAARPEFVADARNTAIDARELANLCLFAARGVGLDPAFLQAIVQEASDGRLFQIGADGGIGIAQLTPDMLAELDAEPEATRAWNCLDPFDPTQSLQGLARLLARCDESLRTVRIRNLSGEYEVRPRMVSYRGRSLRYDVSAQTDPRIRYAVLASEFRHDDRGKFVAADATQSAWIADRMLADPYVKRVLQRWSANRVK